MHLRPNRNSHFGKYMGAVPAGIDDWITGAVHETAGGAKRGRLWVAPYGHPEAHIIWTETLWQARVVSEMHVMQTTERTLRVPAWCSKRAV
jgi:hypothetical protein